LKICSVQQKAELVVLKNCASAWTEAAVVTSLMITGVPRLILPHGPKRRHHHQAAVAPPPAPCVVK
jgi:hypothetical protein